MSKFPEHQVRPIGICIDYDDTFTTSPEVWTHVIDYLRISGADVFCITARGADRPVHDFPGKVYYANNRPKWKFAHENDIDVHIWIDDMPELIGENPLRRAWRAA